MYVPELHICTMFLRISAILNRKLHVLTRTHDPQHEAHRNRESRPSWIMHDIRAGKLIFFPASLEFASPCRKDVLHPLRLAAIGERDNEAVRRSKHVHWSSVDVTRFATHMRENAETRKPTCEQSGDPVRDRDVDLRQPSLTEPHHEHARGGDGDDYDGCGIHGLMKSDTLALIPRWRTPCRVGDHKLVSHSEQVPQDIGCDAGQANQHGVVVEIVVGYVVNIGSGCEQF